jgi:hypothetical protein
MPAAALPDSEPNDALLNELRQKYGLDKTWDREVRKVFEAAILDHYLRAFQTHANNLSPIGEEWKEDDVSKRWAKEVGTVLGLNEGTVWRLEQGEQRLSTDNMLLYLTAVDLPLRAIDFPPPHAIRLGGTITTLVYIRQRIGEAQAEETLDSRQAEWLLLALQDPRWREAENEQELDNALTAILRGFGRSAASGGIGSVTELRQLMARWFIPWVLFDKALPDWAY